MQVNPRNGDLAIAVLLLAVAVFFLWGGWHMPAGTFSVPGPGVVPTILGVLLAVTALLILVKTLIAGFPGTGVPVRLEIAPVAVVFGLLTAGAFAFERTGFMATTGVFLFAMLRVFSRLGTLRSALVGAGIALAAHWFFGGLLGVNLPRGPW
ncbi:MAG: tripartite tricarboxylate transporter TctB family protein [Betaproteobacteria bacterium]|nr:tripartite tricarboxylate transporter TctB family protein [Betaproteobacteria bacterium]